MASQTLSIYLLKEGVSSIEALKEEHLDDLKDHSLTAGDTVGTLYVSQGEESSPDWVDFLAGVTRPPALYRTKSLSAVLLLEASERWFAITFGYGRRLLDPEAYERYFGLLCTLNSVDPEKLRGAEARTFDEYALHTLRQLSGLSTISSLEINTDRELVVSLAGQLEDPELGKRIDGRDAVRITADLTPAQLRAKCSELLGESRKKTYRKRFPFFDTIKRVSDPAELEWLEEKALTALGKQHYREFDVFPPQIVPDEIIRFELSDGSRRERVIEPNFELLYQAVQGPRPRAKVKSRLDRLRLQGIDEHGDVVDEWSLFRCLHWEFKKGAAVYVLDGGQWYRIARRLVNEVEEFAEEMKSSQIEWPAATSTQKEGPYNRAAATALNCALLDKHLVRLPEKSPIEPCDLFTSKRQFIHVKRLKGGSGPVSHLFAQALVSAEGLVMEPEFRKRLRTLLGEAKPGYGRYVTEKGTSREYPIVLALIAKPGLGNIAKELPFFSQVTLRLAVKQLRSMGFEVFLDRIPMKTARRKKAKVRRQAKKVAGRATVSRRISSEGKSRSTKL